MRLTPNYNFLAKITILFALGGSVLFSLLTWLMWRTEPSAPLWGQKSMTVHLFLIGIVLSFACSVLASTLTLKALRRHNILPLRGNLKNQTMLDRLPSSMFHRSFFISLMGGCYAFLLVYLLRFFGIESLQVMQFVYLNSVFGMWLAIGTSVISVYRVLGTYQAQ